MVRGVENAAPEYPDAFALDVEERDALVPPRGGLAGEIGQAGPGEFDEAGGVGRGVWLSREDFGWRWFRGTEKLAEEAAFGEELVGEDLLHCAGFGVGPVRDRFRRQRRPNGEGLVGLAHVGIQQVLVGGVGGNGDVGQDRLGVGHGHSDYCAGIGHLQDRCGVYRKMWLAQVAIGVGFLVLGTGQFLLSESMVAQQASRKGWPPVSITPFTDRVADPGGFWSSPEGEDGELSRGPKTGDRVVAVEGAPFTGMASYLVRYWKRPRSAGITMTFQDQAGVERTWTSRPSHCTLCGFIGGLWAVSVWGIAPFFCLGMAWVVVVHQPRSPLAWAFVGLMLSLSQFSLWPEFNDRFGLVGSPMGWEGWYRVPVLAGQTFLKSAWPAFLLLAARVFRPLGWLGKCLVAAFLVMAGVEAQLAVAWSEEFHPWAGWYAMLAEHRTPLALLGMAGVTGWLWTADRWLGAVAGVMTVTAGMALYGEPEPLRSYEWVLYSDDSRRLKPNYPDYARTTECVELLATQAILLALILRAGRRTPLPLLGAGVLYLSVSVYVGSGLAGYPRFLIWQFWDESPDVMLVAAGTGVALAGWGVLRLEHR